MKKFIGEVSRNGGFTWMYGDFIDHRRIKRIKRRARLGLKNKAFEPTASMFLTALNRGVKS